MLSADGWVLALRRYFMLIVPAHLVWEFLQLPLYTIWHEGTANEILFAVVHCTGGDILIASSTLLLSLLLAGSGWPENRDAFRRIAAMTVAFGVGYTVFSEWLNTEVQENWAYAEAMPVLPVIGTGLSPLLQWVVIPSLGFWWVARAIGSRSPGQADR